MALRSLARSMIHSACWVEGIAMADARERWKAAQARDGLADRPQQRLANADDAPSGIEGLRKPPHRPSRCVRISKAQS